MSKDAFVITNWEQLQLDEQLARTLEQLDRDATASAKKREEEDRNLAMLLAMEEERYLDSSLTLHL